MIPYCYNENNGVQRLWGEKNHADRQAEKHSEAVRTGVSKQRFFQKGAVFLSVGILCDLHHFHRHPVRFQQSGLQGNAGGYAGADHFPVL